MYSVYLNPVVYPQDLHSLFALFVSFRLHLLFLRCTIITDQTEIDLGERPPSAQVEIPSGGCAYAGSVARTFSGRYQRQFIIATRLQWLCGPERKVESPAQYSGTQLHKEQKKWK
jgi:hypothetical protein